MRRSRFTQEQIAFALRQAENGTSVGEVCRKMGISENTFYRWKRKFEGLGVAEIRRLRQLEVTRPQDRYRALSRFFGQSAPGLNDLRCRWPVPE